MVEKNEKGRPDYSIYGRYKNELMRGDHRILRHGESGPWGIDPDGKVQYQKDGKSAKPPKVMDPTGKAVKVGPDNHGFVKTLMEGAQRAGITLPMHVAVLMADAANAIADVAVDDHFSYMAQGVKGDTRDKAKNQIMTKPFHAMMQVGEEHLKPDDLRLLMQRVAADFRGGKSDTMADGTFSPIPIPLSAVARMHQTNQERRDGKDPKAHMEEKDAKFHDALSAYHKESRKATSNPQGMIDKLSGLRESGKHLIKEAHDHSAKIKADDARKPPKFHEEHAKKAAEMMEAKQDANTPPMQDEDITKLRDAVDTMHKDSHAFHETSALPAGTMNAHRHVANDLSQAVERESAKAPNDRVPMESVLSRSLVRGMQHRTNGHIARAQKEIGAPAWHHVAHRDILNDRHSLAAAIVEGAEKDPEHSLAHKLGVDPHRLARQLTESLPDPEEMLKLLTEAGLVPQSLVTPPKTDKKKVGVEGSGKPAVMVVKSHGLGIPRK